MIFNVKEWQIALLVIAGVVVVWLLARQASGSSEVENSEGAVKPAKNNLEKKQLILQCSREYFSPKTDEEIVRWLIARIVMLSGPKFRIAQVEIWKNEHLTVNDRIHGPVETVILGFNCSYEVYGRPYFETWPNGNRGGGTLVDDRGGFTAVYEVCVTKNAVILYGHGLATIDDYKSISWGHDKKYWNDPGGPLTESLFNDCKVENRAVEVLFGRHLVRNYPDYTSKRQDTRYVVHTKFPLGPVCEEEIVIRH